ncbi:glycosyltransferase family 2 protein [Candidatus Dependentiae bacterium]|nr:glycosyltransferase family 2 protein [Candidatus Dependentiae bacterium]
MDEYVTIAILAKDKAHTLPLFLQCIQNQTWPAERTYLYVRTNNNNDDTAQILRLWLDQVQHRYAKIYFNDQAVAENIQQFGQHEWNGVRFKILGKIRQESVAWAYEQHSHYFVVDCDNFIKPHTIEKLMQDKLSIVAPFLIRKYFQYSNYHAAVDQNGYFQPSDNYFMIFNRQVTGLIEVPVVHCAYFIRYDTLPFILYDDDSYRYEYVIFSDQARKKRITQYIDNRDVYGMITFATNKEELEKEGIEQEVLSWFKK